MGARANGYMVSFLSSNANLLELGERETRGHGERPITRRSVLQLAILVCEITPTLIASTGGRRISSSLMVIPSDSGLGPFVTFPGDHRTNTYHSFHVRVLHFAKHKLDQNACSKIVVTLPLFMWTLYGGTLFDLYHT